MVAQDNIRQFYSRYAYSNYKFLEASFANLGVPQTWFRKFVVLMGTTPSTEENDLFLFFQNRLFPHLGTILHQAFFSEKSGVSWFFPRCCYGSYLSGNVI